MREGLRDPKQLLTISNCLLQAATILDTIIWVDKIIFERVMIVVFVGVRGRCSARHHGGHVIRKYRAISRFGDSSWAECNACCKTCCAIVLSPGLKAASSATCATPTKLNTRRVQRKLPKFNHRHQSSHANLSDGNPRYLQILYASARLCLEHLHELEGSVRYSSEFASAMGFKLTRLVIDYRR